MSENHWDEREKNRNEAEEALARVRSESKGREWQLLEKVVSGIYVEQRRARRWGIFFKGLTFLYLFALLGLFFVGNQLGESDKAVEVHTAVIEVAGPIAADEDASADNLVGSLREAFDEPKAKAVVLRINSPGGSPVQAGYVYDEIKRLRALHPEKKVYAVIADMGASGAYYIAAAADEIYADKASLVGSIGVTASGFGFVELMDKLGVERRIYTAGEHKAFLDPFSPANEREGRLWQEVLNTTHRQFIEQVRQGRGERLTPDDRLFSGLVWTGEQALELGLVDGLGSTSYVARELVGHEKLVEYMPKRQPWQEIVDRLGASFGKALATELGISNSNGIRLQ
ncbi:S49 family peptidase [Marinobacterium arenosum]|uniref:S49 family peptidase n=1 Tax=Marinobacterium arenosum TaxID=2862496 RepID=UPI001C93BA93|nr:S49 family peptidase [Marinobacterium arenosum]MBY4677171.1 S49 family peptidase [Marinobacterium arenosum]